MPFAISLFLHYGHMAVHWENILNLIIATPTHFSKCHIELFAYMGGGGGFVMNLYLYLLTVFS